MITLNREDCYCELYIFYENVAKRMGVTITDDTRYDCTKISTTVSVQDEICAYYKNEKSATDEEINMLLACYGAKANLKRAGMYGAEVEDGFISGYRRRRNK